MYTDAQKSRIPEDDQFFRGEVVSRCCSTCRIWHPIVEYKANRMQPGVRGRVCKSCRSTKARLKYQSDPMHRARHIFEQRKSSAKKSGIPFEITLEWFKDKIRNGKCAVTGIDFDLSCSGRSKYSPSIDQIVPSAGYTPENARVVVLIYNTAKNHWSDADILDMARILTEKNK